MAEMAHEADVLVVDDSEEVRDLAALLFEKLGLKLHAVPDVAAAKKWLSSMTPKLIIADIMMPDGNGLDFLKWARSQGSLESVPFIVSSSLAEEETIQDALELGATDYIKKPLTLDALKSKLRRVLYKN